MEYRDFHTFCGQGREIVGQKNPDIKGENGCPCSRLQSFGMLRMRRPIGTFYLLAQKLVFRNSDLDKSTTAPLFCKARDLNIHVHKVRIYEVYAHKAWAQEVHVHNVRP
jgi:hypothetical protein